MDHPLSRYLQCFICNDLEPCTWHMHCDLVFRVLVWGSRVNKYCFLLSMAACMCCERSVGNSWVSSSTVLRDFYDVHRWHVLVSTWTLELFEISSWHFYDLIKRSKNLKMAALWCTVCSTWWWFDISDVPLLWFITMWLMIICLLMSPSLIMSHKWTAVDAVVDSHKIKKSFVFVIFQIFS